MTNMPRLLKLDRPLAANAATDPNDVHDIKALLTDLGFYEVPDWGVSGYPDRALFDAIRAYQKECGLKVDGVLKPEGETEASLRALQARALKPMAAKLQAMGRNGDTILAHITPAEAQLLDAVTDGGSISPETGLPEFFDLGGVFDGLGAKLGEFGAKMADSLSNSLDAMEQGSGATMDFVDNYMDMLSANVKKSDKYFHCKANCEASRRGVHGDNVAKGLSNVRELWDQNVKGYPFSDSRADQKANQVGRAAAKTFRSCREGCAPYRPRGLPSRY